MHYQNRIDVIPYQAYVYVEIYCNQNKPIHFNAHFKGSILIPLCYGVSTVVLRSAYHITFIQHTYNKKFIQHVYTIHQNNKSKSKIKRKINIDLI